MTPRIADTDRSALRRAIGGHLYAVTQRLPKPYDAERTITLQTNELSRAQAEARRLRGRLPRIFERVDTDTWRRVK